MRHITEEGLTLIRKWESFQPKRYICPAGWPTIGYGHVIKAHEEARFAVGLSRDEATQLLKLDVRVAENAVLRYISVALEDHHFDALVSFAFNAGAGALQRSTLRRMVNREEFEEAADEFKKWVFGGGKKLKGLVNRRAEEAALFKGARVAEDDDLDPQEDLRTVQGWFAALPWAKAPGSRHSAQ